MTLTPIKNAQISIVADASNAIIPDTLRAQLLFTPGVTIQHADASLPNNSNAGQIATKLQGAHELVIAGVGVPSTSVYQARINALLDAWEITPSKPTLLISTPAPQQTVAFVDSWLAAKPHFIPVRGLIGVNEPYLIQAGRDNVIEQLEKQLNASRQLNELLLNNLQQPSDTVRQPSIQPNRTPELSRS